MNMSLLQSKRLNDWPLFFLFFGFISLAMFGYMLKQDMSTPLGISKLIQASVRFSVPFLFLAFASSSIAAHVPKPLKRWLTRNRRYFGLGFAAGFGWQLFFILWLYFGHHGYFMEEVFTSRKSLVIYRLGPYTFLVAMTITSFFPVRRKMNRKVWHVIHWIGIYYLWWDLELTYWEEIYSYPNIPPDTIDYIYCTLGGLAYLARVGEWTRIRLGKLRKRIGELTKS